MPEDITQTSVFSSVGAEIFVAIGCIFEMFLEIQTSNLHLMRLSTL